MRKTVSVAEATKQESVLPERVQEALGELVGAAREGLFALSVGVGLGVLTELMEENACNDNAARRVWSLGKLPTKPRVHT